MRQTTTHGQFNLSIDLGTRAWARRLMSPTPCETSLTSLSGAPPS
jgi:hypothetical protein